MISAQLKFRGTRACASTFLEASKPGPEISPRHAQGDATYRLTSDVHGPWGVMEARNRHGCRQHHTRGYDRDFARAQAIPHPRGLRSGPADRREQLVLRSADPHAQPDIQAGDSDLTSLIQQSISLSAWPKPSAARATSSAALSIGWRAATRAALRLTWQEQLYPLARDTILALSAA